MRNQIQSLRTLLLEGLLVGLDVFEKPPGVTWSKAKIQKVLLRLDPREVQF